MGNYLNAQGAGKGIKTSWKEKLAGCLPIPQMQCQDLHYLGQDCIPQVSCTERGHKIRVDKHFPQTLRTDRQ